LRICLVYDCLFPWTIGGAERWYRNLAERLATEGHDVTYLTLRQWDEGSPPAIPGVRVVAVGPRLALYTTSGRRRILPPLVFGAGVLWHLARHGRRYDVVHTCAFPFFSLLAAAALRGRGRYRIVVDWFEVWTRAYWEGYLGRRAGGVGWRVQRSCIRLRQHAFCFSALHARRLREEGLRGEVTVLAGLHANDGDRPARSAGPPEPVVVFAGRHIPEKRVPALIPAVAAARREAPELRAEIYGDGPERERVAEAVRANGLTEVVTLAGFVDQEVIDRALARALCMVLPSQREGYGMVVVEAASHGTPSVVVADADNAAVELVEDGVNGVVALSTDAADLSAAILRVRARGPGLRESTADWYERNARRLSLAGSLDVVAVTYADPG
jgi:glycosyltransferase involved in cell wall biosynthesis